MAGKFCVTITHCRDDGDKCTVGFVIANAALGSDKETLVFLSTDGVWAAKKGEAEQINEGEPFAPLKDLMDRFLAAGGRINACGPCLAKRGIGEGDLIAGVQVAGGASLVEFLQDGTPSVSF